ncbi:hypothetical protein V475_20405 [Sphingobium baderi LL03]|uniref:Uncharacterized protein n=1 Tax=Sphingobium baderi LL03 TaxID=1114964 RepID=T0HBG1_9SPHN|nr:hypothetical protein L485_22390 [Sphingobium baderi LL03]KMS64103.1 hypothetical protein V475_20405 [Sphingobium baderi LL03]
MHRRIQALGRLKVGAQNKTEASYEATVLRPSLLAGEIAWYRFEGLKLRLADNTFFRLSAGIGVHLPHCDQLADSLRAVAARLGLQQNILFIVRQTPGFLVQALVTLDQKP